MIQNWRKSICQSVGPVEINDISKYVSRSKFTTASPIDSFYAAIKDMLSVASPDFLENHSTIGPLLLVGIVSSTENYFRNLLSRLIRICPISQEVSCDQSVNLGSVLWHQETSVEWGAFEHISFASSETIKSTCKKYLDYDLKQSSQVAAILGEYNKVCELRHNVVHSNSVMAGKNALKLNVEATAQVVKVSIGYEQLQESSLVCSTLVASFNTEMFEAMAKRWAVNWPTIASWNKTKENDSFKGIWKIFYSTIDAENKSIDTDLTIIKCKNRIIKEFSSA